jgi:hypothetical protein
MLSDADVNYSVKRKYYASKKFFNRLHSVIFVRIFNVVSH